jgi:endonuclease VIII-like 1
MPEISEVRLSSEFVSKIGKNHRFERIEKSPVSKMKTDLKVHYKTFTLDSSSRGKEMALHIIGKDETVTGLTGCLTMKVTLGMSGAWVFYDPADPKNEKYHKHTHLRFFTTEGKILGLYDVRRFAKWTWNDFDPRRSPCIFKETEKFRERLVNNWFTHKDFKKNRLCEIMMNQGWFNGVGNYLRAEILYRFDKSPFTIASEISPKELETLIEITINCVNQSYKLGGGQLKDWKNPDGEDPTSFHEWMKCYGLKTSEKTLDATGRTFWFDKKWKVADI